MYKFMKNVETLTLNVIRITYILNHFFGNTVSLAIVMASEGPWRYDQMHSSEPDDVLDY